MTGNTETRALKFYGHIESSVALVTTKNRKCGAHIDSLMED
jgi:hypothetical protein